MLRFLGIFEEKCVVFAGGIAPWSLPYLRRYQRLLRYLAAGGIAATVDLGLLYVFTDIFFIHYLTSAIFAFILTFFISFTLQKFWTFQDRSTHKVHAQALTYLAVALMNLAINTLLMYVLVDILAVWYLGAQFLASGLIAFESFFVSRYFIFHGGLRESLIMNGAIPISKGRRLLIVTQKVDASDNNLGFFMHWIEEFAKHTLYVTVVCLQEGGHNLPENVSVRSLGKEELEIGNCLPAEGPAQVGKLKILRRATYFFRFLHYIWSERRSYDAVFVHMNPEYVLLGGIPWKLLRKEVGFWYTHQSDRFLRSALTFVDHAFTPSLDSFPIRTKKLRIVGHGVDTEAFMSKNEPSPKSPLVILSDNRLTPSKNVEETLKVSEALLKRGVVHTMRIIGAAITDKDKEYERRLRDEVQRKHLPVSFLGGVSFERVPDYYREADIFINHANVGALNKTVLQAMAMNLPVITSNESYRGILPDEALVLEDPNAFVEKIAAYARAPFLVSYRDRIVRNHSLQALIPKILHYYA